MISVWVAASSAVVRAGLETVVRASGFLTMAGAVSIDRLEEQLDEITADVLLLALPRLDDDWIAALATSAIPVVILTDMPRASSAAHALRGNTRSILSPDSNQEEIEAAIVSAAAGLITLQAGAIEVLFDQGGPAPRVAPNPPEEPLTARELEVLGLLGEGVSNKLIAHALGISEHTVKFHVTSIMSKLHAGSRTDAVMQGIRLGLILV
jgi:NarL family two-component system response regulator YdfI